MHPPADHAPVQAPWACFAVAAPGLERFVSAEIAELQCDSREIEGGVDFAVPLEVLPTVLRRLRCASRVLVRMAEGRVDNPTAVATLVDRVAWDLLPARPSRVALRLSAHGAAPDRIRWLQGELVRALLQRFGNGRVSVQAPTGEPDEVALAARLDGRTCTLSVDAGGGPLHQRGWRLEAGPAPLRETLAAAMLRAAGYDGTGLLWDPMCGSGTVAIEAALRQPGAPQEPRRLAIDAWRVPFLLPTPVVASLAGQPRIVAGDLDADVLNLAQRNAVRAGVEDQIQWQHAELALQTLPQDRPAWLVTNPPYGQRLGGRNTARRLYERLASVMLRSCVGWRAAVLVPEPQLVRLLPIAQAEVQVVDNGGSNVWLVTGEIVAARRVPLSARPRG